MAEAVVTTTATAGRRRPHQGLVDCDVHNMMGPDFGTYLPQRWRSYYADYGMRNASSRAYFVTLPHARAARSDAWPPSGLAPGADLDFMREQLLDAWGTSYAVLNPLDLLRFAEEPDDYAAALVRATNDCTLAAWLEPEPRFLASICIAFENVAAAVEEIHRLGDHPRCVQVLFNCRTRDPLGDKKYWPIYEAAVEHGLPIAMHVGGSGGNAITGAGWPSYYYEDHAGFAQAFQSQVLSLVTTGAFAQFPDLKFVLQEGGFTWLLSMQWRLDMAWELLRDELPHLDRRPSEYLRERFWFTTQPIEEPEKPEFLMQMLRRIDLDDRLMFATDYPHWDFDAPDLALPNTIPQALREQIFGGNARALYGLEPR
jgi:predicted TIM-barrel fold metal-dependent hydrolase